MILNHLSHGTDAAAKLDPAAVSKSLHWECYISLVTGPVTIAMDDAMDNIRYCLHLLCGSGSSDIIQLEGLRVAVLINGI